MKPLSAMIAFRSASRDALTVMHNTNLAFSKGIMMEMPDAVPTIIDWVEEHGLSLRYDTPTLRRWFAAKGSKEFTPEEHVRKFLEGVRDSGVSELDLECAFYDVPDAYNPHVADLPPGLFPGQE